MTTWREGVGIYNMRTKIHFTLKTQQMKYEDLRDFSECNNLQNRFKRKETERFKEFMYDEIISRDETNFDIFLLKDESLGDMDNLRDPDVLALEIVENIEAGLASFKEIVEGLNGK